MRIGIIGAGFTGRAAARLAVQHGHDVMLSNSRDPSTLASAMIRCKIGTSEQVAAFGDVVLIAVPYASHRAIVPAPLVGKIVLDAGNYDPARDGSIAAINELATTASELFAEHFLGAHVVKAFNTISESDIEKDARPSGLPGRRALPVAGDIDDVKETVSGLIDRLGFDVVDAGPLFEGWRFDRGHPAGSGRFDSAGLRQALAAAGSALG